MELKKCKHCNVEKPASEFYKNKYNKDGYQQVCTDCWKEINHKSRAKKVFAIPSSLCNHDHSKICIQCWVEKPLETSYFGINSRSDDGFKTICLKCEKDNNILLQKRDFNKYLNSSTPPGFYRCGKCGRLLEETKFRKDSKSPSQRFTYMCENCLYDFTSIPANNHYQKTCINCKQSKEATNTFFNISICHTGFLRNQCKVCRAKANKKKKRGTNTNKSA